MLSILNSLSLRLLLNVCKPVFGIFTASLSYRRLKNYGTVAGGIGDIVRFSRVSDSHQNFNLLYDHRAKLEKSVLDFTMPRLFQEPHVKRRKSVREVLPLKLFIVAALLAKHKYTGYDPRQNNGFEPKNLHRSFPVPPLVALHPIVSKACEEGFAACVQEISEYAGQQLSQSSRLASKIERFEFMTTASYYMCWYTMRRVTDLLQLDSASREEFQCLDFNALRIYRDNFTSSRMWVARPSAPSIEDVRLSKFKRPYLCAELSFCPDYCYGRNTHGIVKDIRRDKGNPCFGLPDSWCSVDPKKNLDFSHLMRNDVNNSCRCEVVHSGFTWNKKLGLCVDVDECQKGLHNCAENMICQNTVGSFQCVCTWGYHWTGKVCMDVTKLQIRSDDVGTTKKVHRESDKRSIGKDWLSSQANPSSIVIPVHPNKIQNFNMIARFSVQISFVLYSLKSH